MGSYLQRAGQVEIKAGSGRTNLWLCAIAIHFLVRVLMWIGIEGSRALG
jgi:hypothetical protein